MKTASAKNKGRKFQQWVRDTLITMLQLSDQDVRSTSMGAAGEDVTLSQYARGKFPFSIECKNTERLNVWNAYKQAGENSMGHEPVVFIKRNHHKPLVVVDAEFFVGLFQ